MCFVFCCLPTDFHLGQIYVVVGNRRSWSDKKKKKADWQTNAETQTQRMISYLLLKEKRANNFQ